MLVFFGVVLCMYSLCCVAFFFARSGGLVLTCVLVICCLGLRVRLFVVLDSFDFAHLALICVVCVALIVNFLFEFVFLYCVGFCWFWFLYD